MLTRFLYKSYGFFYTLRLWRKRHFTSAGIMIMGAVFLSGLLGFNILKTNLYQVLALSFSIMGVSILLSLLPFKLKIKIIRILPEYASIGEKLTYKLKITYFYSKTYKDLTLYENIHDPRPSFDKLISTKEPFEHTRNIWDKKTLYYRWQWLLHKNIKAFFFPVKLPDLPPGESIRVTAEFIPHYRGYIHFSGCTLARPDAIGLFNRLREIKKSQKIVVLPKQYLFASPDLQSTRQYHPGGISFASSIGDCDEFMSLRHYRPGDPLRNIHWRSFAKTNELVIKEFEDEHFVRHALILDTFLTSGNEALFEAGVSTASSYITSMQTYESILDLMFVGNQIFSFPSGRGLAQPEKMLEIMACVEPCEDKTILELFPLLESNIKTFSGSICIFLGWEQGHKKIYQLFKQARIPIFVIILIHNESKADKLKMEEDVFQDINNFKDDLKVIHYKDIQQELGIA
jgi:hypothetical protein